MSPRTDSLIAALRPPLIALAVVVAVAGIIWADLAPAERATVVSVLTVPRLALIGLLTVSALALLGLHLHRVTAATRKHALRIGQSEIRWIGAPFEALNFGDGCLFAGAVRLEQFLGLFAELSEARLGLECARGRRVRRHDVLLSAAVGRMARCPRREPKEGTLAINSNRMSQVGSALSADTAAP